jgi:hypothetical protein
VTAPSFTAEILRNARIQLRPKRVIAAVVICLAASITSIAYFFYAPWADSARAGGQDLLGWTFGIQIAALLIAGGLYCLQSIHREKELNTFDYQRVTRLTPFELVVGKLFGPPAMMYFLVLCTMPLILIGALTAQTSISSLFAAYFLFLLGVVTYHSLALFISLFLPKGSSAGAVIVFLILIYLTSLGRSFGSAEGVFSGLSPFYAESFVNNSSSRFTPDVFFGANIAHGYVLAALYVTLTAWFLLAIARNMKRDPSDFEIYTPLQALGLVLYWHLLLLGFFEWTATYGTYLTPIHTVRAPAEVEASFLTISFWLFLMLGLTLLRNRERSRRRMREFGDRAANWWAAVWPAPYVFAGLLFIGAALIFMIRLRLHPESGWSSGMAIFELVFFALWLARDLVFLQWANLRRSRRPLVSGALYLVAYYGCAMALFYATGAYAKPDRLAYSSTFFPSGMFRMDYDMWTADLGRWIVAAIVLAAEGLVFVFLQRRTLQHILNSAPTESAAIQQPLTPK